MESEKIILGVDPGTQILGYAVILQKGNTVSLLKMDVLKLNKLASHELKIKTIFDSIIQIIDEFHPDFLAIESPFFGKNVQSMLKLGRAQGVTIAAALSREIPYCEYPPKRIKQSITGNGNASKEQVALMLERILKFPEMPKYLDATDALATAMCHFFQKDIPTSEILPTKAKPKKKTSWQSFVSQNPKRIV